MPIDLNTFVRRAQSIDADRSICLDSHGSVKDRGAVGTFFTRASTFRNTTNEFVRALSAEYGAHVGDMARALLHQDVEAGRPLKASVVKEFVALGSQHRMQDMLMRISSESGAMDAFVGKLVKQDDIHLSDAQFQQISRCVRQCAGHLVNGAVSKQDVSLEGLVEDLVQHHSCPLLMRTVDLVTGNQNSPLVRLGYPGEGDASLIADKLRVLSMIQPAEGAEVSDSVLIQAMTALLSVREGVGEFTGADIFTAAYPPGTTPGLERPSEDVMALYTPHQMSEFWEHASTAFMEGFTARQLPADSPVRGTPEHTEVALRAAKNRLFMPQTLSTLSGDRVTLADLPQIQFDITANSKYEDYHAAVAMLTKDLPRRGTMGLTDEGVPPSIGFVSARGVRHQTVIGSKKYKDIPENQLTDDQRAYMEGRHNSVVDELIIHVNDLCRSMEQKKAVMGCLNQSGSYPLWHALQAFGDFGAFREHCAYNQEVIQRDDGSVDVTLTTSADLKSINGTATMTYHVDVDGRIGITDFQWEKPSLADRKEGVKHCGGYRESVASHVNQIIKEHKLGRLASHFISTQAHAMIDPLIDGATTHGEFMDMEALQGLFHGDHPIGHRLQNLVAMAESQRALLFSLKMAPEDLETFMEATILFNTSRDDLGMAMIQEHLPELHALRRQGNLTAETGWQALFGEPLGEDVRQQMARKTPGNSSVIASKLFEDFGQLGEEVILAQVAEKSVDESEMTNRRMRLATAGVMCFQCGFSLERSRAVVGGARHDHIGLADLRPQAGLVLSSRLEDVDNAESQLSGDMHRMGVNRLADLRHPGNAPLGPSLISVALPSVRDGAPERLEVDPRHPQGLSEREKRFYDIGKHNPISGDIRERVTAFCGEDHAAQIVGVLTAMGQAGQQFTNNLAAAMDIQGTEHGDARISVFGDDQRNVHVRYENVEGAPLRFHWEFVLAPDGSQTLADLDMTRVNP